MCIDELLECFFKECCECFFKECCDLGKDCFDCFDCLDCDGTENNDVATITEQPNNETNPGDIDAIMVGMETNVSSTNNIDVNQSTTASTVGHAVEVGATELNRPKLAHSDSSDSCDVVCCLINAMID